MQSDQIFTIDNNHHTVIYSQGVTVNDNEIFSRNFDFFCLIKTTLYMTPYCQYN